MLAGAPSRRRPRPAPSLRPSRRPRRRPQRSRPPRSRPDQDKKADKKADDQAREPDFVVPGAPPEPTDELPLPTRATLLAKRMNAAAKPTRKLVNYWLYQHSLDRHRRVLRLERRRRRAPTLIRTDLRLQKRFGFGKKSAAVARAGPRRRPAPLDLLMRRVIARAREQRGYTMIELLMAMIIMVTVVTALTALFVSGARAELELNRRFEAQQAARVAADRMRREVHCASSVTFTSAANITVVLRGHCPTASAAVVHERRLHDRARLLRPLQAEARIDQRSPTT